VKNNIRYTQNDIENWFEYGVNLKKRKIYLGTFSENETGEDIGIDGLSAEYFIKGMEILENNKNKITVILNSAGGDEFHGMAIYDRIMASICPVDIEVYGHAMSMGAVILQAGRKRLMHPNSALMIHDGYTGSKETPLRSARNWSDFEEKLRYNMYHIFSEKSGKSKKYWETKCTNDAIFSPEEAVEEGLADSVLEANWEYK